MRKLLNKIKDVGGEHILFVGATIFSAGIHFLFSIYVKAYVTPSEYGLYSTCLLLQTYLTYLQLGTLNAFNRDYPQLVGAKKNEEAKAYRNTIFSFLLVIYSIAVFVIIFLFHIMRKRVELDYRLKIGFIFSAIITMLTIIENYGNYRCRIDKGFTYSSIVNLLELISILVGIILIPKIGYYGIYITNIITMLIGIFSYFQASYKDFKFCIKWGFLKEILASGMPLLVNGLIWTIVNSIDKFVILGFINTEALGLYGIAQNVFSYMVLIPSAMSQLFYVKMGKEYGSVGKVETLTRVAIKYTMILSVVTSLISIIAYFFLPILVENIMPNYNKGVLAAQILIIGLAVYAATLVNGNILTILKQNNALLFNSICMCFFNIICSIMFVFIWGSKIESVALGTATSYIFCSWIIIWQVHKYGKCKIYDLVKVSVIPTIISLLPGIYFYETIENRIIGFVITIGVIIVFYILFYGKRINSVLKELRK